MSTTENMTIHKALCELKIIGDRISKGMGMMPFVLTNEKANTKIQGIPIAEYVEQMKEAFQSVTDLIDRRDAIKRAVVQSNAVTTVVIGGKEYTVDEESWNGLH